MKMKNEINKTMVFGLLAVFIVVGAFLLSFDIIEVLGEIMNSLPRGRI